MNVAEKHENLGNESHCIKYERCELNYGPFIDYA